MTAHQPPLPAVREAVARALDEDLLPLGDLSGALVPVEARLRGALAARAAGVLAGRRCATETFTAVDPQVHLDWSVDDGDPLRPAQVLATVEGPARSVLAAERTALNFLGHLSGIATLTRRYVDVSAGRARVRDTRKTTPGLRALEKAAVRAGGGFNHRGSLSDGILVKDNHLAAVSIASVVAMARERWPGRGVQVECDRPAQVAEAVSAGAEMVLLDNMTTEQVTACVALVAGRCSVEVSGGVTLENVAAYAGTGADFIAIGALTHSAPHLDIGLDVHSVES